MAPLARLSLQLGIHVSGSDLEENRNTRDLSGLGAKIHIGHKAQNLPADARNPLIVFSSAVQDDNPELANARSKGWRSLRRGEFLAELATAWKRQVAISGSHGKTTVTSMLAHILVETGMNPGFMIGGKVRGWDSSAQTGSGDIFIYEVDESDGTHTFAKPEIGVITNIEDDHCWSVGGADALTQNFAAFGRNCRKLLFFAQNSMESELFQAHAGRIPLVFQDYDSSFLQKWPLHQKWNGFLAIRAAELLGVHHDDAQKALENFPGVDRRMTFHFESDDFILIEDYAHHPTEVKMALSHLKNSYPNHMLHVVFQPHRYARLNRYFDEFATELSQADKVVVTPVFAAWTDANELTSRDLALKIGEKARYDESSWETMAESIMKSLEKPAVLAILGAGDINQLISLLSRSSSCPAKFRLE